MFVDISLKKCNIDVISLLNLYYIDNIAAKISCRKHLMTKKVMHYSKNTLLHPMSHLFTFCSLKILSISRLVPSYPNIALDQADLEVYLRAAYLSLPVASYPYALVSPPWLAAIKAAVEHSQLLGLIKSLPSSQDRQLCLWEQVERWRQC